MIVMVEDHASFIIIHGGIRVSYQFTPTAEQILVATQKEAARFSSQYVYPEHMLLALISEMSGIGASLFEKLKIDIPTFRRTLEEDITGGTNEMRGDNRFYSAETNEVLKYASDQARKTGYHRIGTGHLWLGLLHQSDGIAASVFTKLGIEPENVKQTLLALIGTTNESAAEPTPHRPLDFAALFIRISCWLVMMTLFGFIWQIISKKIANITYPDAEAFLKHGTGVLTWKLHAYWKVRRVMAAFGFLSGLVTGEGLFKLINRGQAAGSGPMAPKS